MSPLRTSGSSTPGSLRFLRRSLAVFGAGAVLAGVAVVVSAAPAAAQQNPPSPAASVTLVAPTDAVVDGLVKVHFTAATGTDTDSIKRYTVWVVSDESRKLCEVNFNVGGTGSTGVRQLDVDFKWDSMRHRAAPVNSCDAGVVIAGDGAYTPNGDHTIKVEIETTGPVPQATRHSDTALVRLDNLPEKPGGVAMAFDADERDVTVSWTNALGQSQAPDLSGYRVQECKSDPGAACDDWKTIAQPGPEKRSMVVDLTEPGTYRYRVAAVRPGVDGSLKLSAFVVPSTEPTRATINPPRSEPGDPTTTTAPPVATVDTSPPAAPRRGGAPRQGAPRVVQQDVVEDRGFTEALPYDPEEIAEAGRPLAGAVTGSDTSGILISIAGGSLMVVLAFQVRLLNRRATLGLEALDADYGDGNEHIPVVRGR